VYVLEEWNWIPILLNLQKVINGTTFDNFMSLVVWNFIVIEIANKLICLWANQICFWGLKSSVTTQLTQKHVPFVSGVHWWLTKQTWLSKLECIKFSALNLVTKIESLFAFMYNYFAHCLKCHLEVGKLVWIARMQR